jgi:hypothetical protein
MDKRGQGDRRGQGIATGVTEAREIRCTGCGSLLAKLASGGALNLQRGDLQATFDGDFHASILCYRARCRTMNVVRVLSKSAEKLEVTRPATTTASNPVSTKPER